MRLLMLSIIHFIISFIIYIGIRYALQYSLYYIIRKITSYLHRHYALISIIIPLEKLLFCPPFTIRYTFNTYISVKNFQYSGVKEYKNKMS